MRLRTCFAPLLSAALLAAGPVLRLGRVRHDFGEVPPGAPVSTTFRLANAGDGPLRILGVVPSCECTTARLDSRQVAAGEATSLTVTFDPAREKGPVVRTVMVLTDDPVMPRVELFYDADVVHPVMASAEAVFFPDTLAHDRITREVRVRSHADRDLALALTAPPPPFLRVAVEPRGREALVKVTVDGAAFPRQGAVEGRLAFATGIPESPRLDLEYYGQAGRAVEARPLGLSFDPGGTGRDQAYTVTLVEIRDRPFRVLGVRSVTPPFRAEVLTRGLEARHEVRVALGAAVGPGSYRGAVVLEVDDPDQDTVEIALRADLAPQ